MKWGQQTEENAGHQKCFILFSRTAILPLSPQTQLPTMPTVEFSPVQTWNSGERKQNWSDFCLFNMRWPTGWLFLFLWQDKKLNSDCYSCRSAVDRFSSFWGPDESKWIHTSVVSLLERPHQVKRTYLSFRISNNTLHSSMDLSPLKL